MTEIKLPNCAVCGFPMKWSRKLNLWICVKHEKAVYFSGKIFHIGNSLAVVIPKSNADYLGIKEGDQVDARIIKVNSCSKKR